jgi:hypothetical protein
VIGGRQHDGEDAAVRGWWWRWVVAERGGVGEEPTVGRR